MREIVEEVGVWWRDGQAFALATVVEVFRSAPRQPGAAMAVNGAGDVAGSVSGGCVEGAVYELAMDVLATGAPQRVRYGISDDDAFAVGLTCGGEIDLLIEAVDAVRKPFFGDIASSISDEEPVAIATVVSGCRELGATLAVWLHDSAGTLGNESLDLAVRSDARGMLEQGQSAIRSYGPDGERRLDAVEVFVRSFAPRPRMLVFGAIDYARAVAEIGSFLGYRVTVCDARAVFATSKRFPYADEVVVDWPHRFLQRTAVDGRTIICVLTHDPKFDVPVLEIALRSNAVRRRHGESSHA